MIFKEVIKGGYVQRPELFMAHRVGAFTVLPVCFKGPLLSLAIQLQQEAKQ